MKRINLNLGFLIDLSKESDPEKRYCKLLLKAIEKNNSILVNTLLPDVKNKEQIYPDALFHATHLFDTSIMDILLKDGANVNQTCNPVGECPLHIAAEKGRHIMVQFLLESGADVKKKTKFGLTPLHVAGSAVVIDVLLDKGADIEAEDNSGQSPLHWSIETKRPETLVEHFLLQGARLDKNKLKEKRFCPGKIVTELIVKTQVANIDNDIAKLDPSKQFVDESFQTKCKNELGELRKFKIGTLRFIELLNENYTDFSFFEHNSTTYNFLTKFSSNFPIYYKFLQRNYKRAGKKFESLLASTSNYVTIDAVGKPLNVTICAYTKRKLMCSVPIDSLDTRKRMKAEVTDQ